MDNQMDARTAGGVPAPSDLFESMKLLNEHGAEYWCARSIMDRLGYKQWRRFEGVIVKAVASCRQSDNEPGYHFAKVGKPISGGKGAVQSVADYHLSRFACYLIAQNGDPQKPEIASAQKYFAIQTRRQELSDQAAADTERLELRNQVVTEFKALSGAARQAGVQNKMFGIFHDAGYKGLYGGIGNAEIKRRKGIPEKESLTDRMGSTELAANQFRMTQTREKLPAVNTQEQAIALHERVGREVRIAIEKIQGTMPEHLKPAEHIKQVKKRVKTAKPAIRLDETHARGLIGSDGPSPAETFDDI
jgi:DNA-damage-inducible protein D